MLHLIILFIVIHGFCLFSETINVSSEFVFNFNSDVQNDFHFPLKMKYLLSNAETPSGLVGLSSHDWMFKPRS